MKRLFALMLLFVFVLCSCNGEIADNSSDSKTSDISQNSNQESSGDVVSSENTSSSEIDDSSSNLDPDNDKEKPTNTLPYLIIGGIEVTIGNCNDVFDDGTVSVEYYNETQQFGNSYLITLNNAKIACDVLPDSPEMESVNGIICETDVRLKLIGENEIFCNYSAPDYIWYRGISYVGDDTASLTVIGDGSLDINLGNQENLSNVYGIEYDNFVLNENAIVNIKAIGGDALGVLAYGKKGISVNDNAALKVDVKSNDAITGLAVEVSDISVCGNGLLEIIDSKEDPYQNSIYESAPAIYVDENAKVILRGCDTVYYGNYFNIQSKKYLPKVYISDNPNADSMGRMPREAEIIYGEIIGLLDSKYVCIQSGSQEKYNLWVGGVNVTPENASDIFGDGSASFDGIYDLKLNNAEIKGAVAEVPFDKVEYGIYSCSRGFGLSIYLTGENTISCTDDDVYMSCGISTIDYLTIGLGGTLNVNTGEAGCSVGIVCDDYWQHGGDVKVVAKDSTIIHGASYGIFSFRQVNVVDGSLYAQCGESGFNGSISCTLIDADDAEVQRGENYTLITHN